MSQQTSSLLFRQRRRDLLDPMQSPALLELVRPHPELGGLVGGLVVVEVLVLRVPVLAPQVVDAGHLEPEALADAALELAVAVLHHEELLPRLRLGLLVVLRPV